MTGPAAPASPPVVPPSIDTIKRLVAAQFGVSVIDITSARRDRQTVLARQTVMLLAREMTTLSLPTIGRLLGDRDHTTVMAGVRQMRSRVMGDPALAEIVAGLRRALQPGGAVRRFHVGWRHTGTGERGVGATALTEVNARPLIERLQEEDTGNFAYELVPVADVQTWKEQAHG